jgi:uncharacterized protein YdhG (YjbR/CyaY superfamily)
LSEDPHAAYLATLAPEPRRWLELIRAEVEARLPHAERCIAYRMPALRQGRVFFYFAAFSKHIGIYPPVMKDEALIAELAPWRAPIPVELLARVAVALHAEYAVGAAQGG